MPKLLSINIIITALSMALMLLLGTILWLHTLIPMLLAVSLNILAVHIHCNQSDVGPFGENLASGYSDVKASVDAWYNEISQYNFANGGFSVCLQQDTR